MDYSKEQLMDTLAKIAPNHYLQAVLIIVLFVLVAKITNKTGGPYERYRIRVKVGVAYGSDIDKVKSVLMDVADSQPEVCKAPAPRVRFRGFGDSSLDHELLCWVDKPVLRGRVTHLLNTAVYKRFIKEGIGIPFPQRDVHVHAASALSTG